MLVLCIVRVAGNGEMLVLFCFVLFFLPNNSLKRQLSFRVEVLNHIRWYLGHKGLLKPQNLRPIIVEDDSRHYLLIRIFATKICWTYFQGRFRIVFWKRKLCKISTLCLTPIISSPIQTSFQSRYNLAKCFTILLAISHFWQHSYGWIRRILNVFCNKHTHTSEILLYLFIRLPLLLRKQLYRSFDHILCV